MKKTMITLTTALVVLIFSGAVVAGAVESLRGEQPLTENAKEPAKKQALVVKGGIERSYKQQPPVIPHAIDKDEINLKVNTCLNCHSEKTFEAKKAPKVGDSHFIDRDGKVLKTISSRRYFCEQCHAPQLNADPLVVNNFEGVK
ncbi:MAG: nitrate reductase cytochrome c-type subunit [Gammaproteobacteria bacterium]|nr:nitrate reductase cytochrome c-type subunit [Gammaproteobacteria bacterium]HXK57600.1 nitrate reductase cytochrome c-type subunit [Gammaproteobacteria bacterium]